MHVIRWGTVVVTLGPGCEFEFAWLVLEGDVVAFARALPPYRDESSDSSGGGTCSRCERLLKSHTRISASLVLVSSLLAGLVWLVVLLPPPPTTATLGRLWLPPTSG